jgi:hypothetical protein
MSPRQRRSTRHEAARRADAAPPEHRSAFQPHPHQRTDDGNAFMPDPEGGPARIQDDLAESLAEEFVAAATRGSEPDDDVLDGVVPEELGGPFVETTAAEEFANDTDDMNPLDAEPEPLPRPNAGLVSPFEEEAELEAEGEGAEGGREPHPKRKV